MVGLHPPGLLGTLLAAGSPIAWPEALAVSGLVSLVMVGSGTAVMVVAARAAEGRLSRNRLAGIRTRATLASDEAWSAAHRAGACWTRFGGLASVAAGVVPPLTALGIAMLGRAEARTYMAVWTAVFLTGVVVLLAAVIRGAVVGNRAAKAVNNPDPLAGRGCS